ncbi:extracellular solute-binding protein [Ensifer sp. SSB1]|jgi:multiple sugar transport system substrate-binding protein|uniref:extracellular solute-binding protein n=1 Tax=Ensifer sp. SSB1 TaxID=2795385 RepID=UPI001A603F76|nr:extracellular solute-binding protein [Ensifer sp. SSB1]MBK5567119.1 extracellular solute-binding protein [Ensifer sp. SSB1]
MYEKEKDLISAFLRGEVDRRGMLKGLGAAGLAAGTAGTLFNMMSTQALAADFDWKAHSGKKLKLLLNKHPYADAMIANLQAFKDLTGIEVTYDVFPEDVYFDKVTAALSSGSAEYDAFMTGAYMTWTYGPAGWIADLNEWIKDPTKTNPNYNWDDFLAGVKNSCAWNGQPGGALGSEDAKQWCIPWAFEQNNITYNREMFDKAGVELPKNLDDMIAVAAKLQKDIGGIYGIGVRGSRSWATIHPGFLSGYANFNQKDLNVSADGKLSAAMGTAESKAYHAKFVQMIQESGPKDWSTYTWYQVGTDLGAGASAMIFDADCLGYFMNGGDNKMAGKLGYAAFAANPEATASTPNIWIWSLAMSNFSKDKDATWYFLQWASGPEHALFGATKMDFVDPVRQSIWKDEIFREKLNGKYPGYVEMFDASAAGASIKFTPQPLFFDVTTEWASTLQKMVAKQVPVDEGLDQLVESINRQLQEAGLG